LSIIGTCKLICKYNEVNHEIIFYVVNDVTESLLGLKTCIELRIITKNEPKNFKETNLLPAYQVERSESNDYQNINQTFGEVFWGIGRIDPPYKIKIDDNATQVISPIRKVPFAVLNKLKETLSNLEKLKIIERVQGPSEWVHLLVIVKKDDDSLRICLDPLHLNKVIKREHCKLLTFDEITAKLGGAQIFSKLDVSQAFYQIALDESSSMVGTPFGRYTFLRLPYGVKCAPEVFNERFCQIFDGIVMNRVGHSNIPPSGHLSFFLPTYAINRKPARFKNGQKPVIVPQ
jgi:hypothetical protein